MMRPSSRVVVATCIAALGLALQCSTAAAGKWTPWSPAFAPYPNEVASPQEILPGAHAQFMWYCANGSNCSTGTEAPYEVEFRYRFFSANPFSKIVLAQGYIQSDDYFRLTINGRVVDAGWLEDEPLLINDPNDPRYDKKLRVPRFLGFSEFVVQGENEILIYACDGHRQVVGARCEQAASRDFHYAFFEGGFGDGVTPIRDLLSGPGWEARAFISEPPALASLMIALSALACTVGRRKRP